MSDPRELRWPKSREAAATFIYGNRAAFDPERCAAENTTTYHHRQCRRRPGFGPLGMFCRQHGPLVARLTAEAL